MKHRLLELLCCPLCGGGLTMEILRESQQEILHALDKPGCHNACGLHNCSAVTVPVAECVACYGHEIEEGLLTCTKCRVVYPVVAGIPRLLPLALLHETLTRYHPDFLVRYGARIGVEEVDILVEKHKVTTLHTFSYQWTTFRDNYDYFREIFLSFVQPFLDENAFQGRLVLEVGCGSGRPASVAASLGAEVVAVDLSEAVQSAHALSRHYPHLHVVQADAYALPLRPAFDFVYSVGVLQHLPNPGEALQQIAKVVASGRSLVLWVYGVREAWYRPVDWLRFFTVRMPFRWLHILSVILALLSELFLLQPYRVLKRIPVTRGLAERIPGRIYARFPFRENVIGWFDRLGAPVTHYFSRADVDRMLEEAGFRDIEVAPRPGASASWIARGVRR
ncbi:MAG: methyltransferase domain-containing protein [Candidatus Thiodiazotropha sp. (ex Epidulcina cf. delphinae)]|nr:methyltransferase domain-containing protein [Candidatus Thiodiazotropha sp. (ex Epidulcina cf. delphinae)]